MSFKINGLSAFQFRSFVGKSDVDLARLGVQRYVADCDDGYPCRVSLEDAKTGETVYLVNYKHHTPDTPYRASGPIFIRESATETYSAIDELPEQLTKRILSLRGYDKSGNMRHADVVDGQHGGDMIKQFFADDDIAYVQIHNARYGCFMAQAERA